MAKITTNNELLAEERRHQRCTDMCLLRTIMSKEIGQALGESPLRLKGHCTSPICTNVPLGDRGPQCPASYKLVTERGQLQVNNVEESDVANGGYK